MYINGKMINDETQYMVMSVDQNTERSHNMKIDNTRVGTLIVATIYLQLI